MDNFIHADIFFVISSVGFIIIFILVCICLVYTIRTMRSVMHIVHTIERGIANIDETTRDLIEDLRDSSVFQFVFGKKKKKAKVK